jgi:hypothetical protein
VDAFAGLVLQLCAGALLGDMSIHLGTAWFWRPHRVMPLLPVFPQLAPISGWVSRHPTVNALCVLAQIGALLLVTAGFAPAYPIVLKFAVAMHLFLGVLDQARLILTLQLTFSLCAFLFPSPLTVVQFCLSGVYWYSGMSKVIQVSSMPRSCPLREGLAELLLVPADPALG